jgi:hypothetical protein
LKVIGGFGVFAGLTAAVPFAFAAGVESIWASIAWEVAGAIVVALLMMGLAASALTHADRATDLGKTDEESWHQRRRGVNPATGLPMVNRSIDAGGEPYGCGFSSSDDHRWDRD